MKILLVGAGGYASGYVKNLLAGNIPFAEFEGVVDPYFDSAKDRDDILKAGIPVYPDMDAFYAEHSADLAVVCVPTYLHRECSVKALEKGSYVLCEKPAAPTLDDVCRMAEAEKHFGRWIAIGYQWSFSNAVRMLKQDILDGVFGSPIMLKTAISWPRSKDYYGRGTGWAGKISKNGALVLDSIASNACAHYIHNMLFVLGGSMEKSVDILSFEAECYRANDIENFDTCSIKMYTKGGTELYFIASHAAEKKRDPEFIYRFEKADIIYSRSEENLIRATFKDGREKIYGNPFEDDFKKLKDSLVAIKENTRPICTVDTATPHVKLIEELYRDVPISSFPSGRVGFNSEKNTVYVKGLFDDMYKAYELNEMLSKIFNG